MKTGWTIGRKLILSFLGVAAITLILGIVGYYGIDKEGAALHEVAKVRLPSVDSLLIIEESAENIKGTLRTLGIPGLAPEVRQRQYDNLERARKKYESAWAVYEPLPQTSEEAKVWQQFVPAWKAWTEENNKFIEMAREFDRNGIADPKDLVRQIERFTKDHYILVHHVNHLLNHNERFDGGEDHTACSAGRWLPDFSTENQEFQALIQAFETPHKRFHDAVGAIKQAVGAGAVQEATSLYQGEMIPSMEAVFGAFDQMLALANESMALMDAAQAQMLGPAMDAQRTAMGLLDQLVEINREVALQEVESVGYLKTVTLVGILFSVALALALGILITRAITKPLNKVIEGLSEGAEQVASASGQVSSASQQMAEGSSEQASSLEETSSSLEEMSSMTKQNAANADQADGLMKEANNVVTRADQSMTELTTSMEEISRASEETSKIIKTIDEIAFQTNLLALNAAVEAARAGEAGAGFAVVADEVRNLAMRAAEAAKNTANLIEGTVKKVKGGGELVAGTNDAFKEVTQSVAKVGELVGEIAAASNEQAQGIEQVNTAMAEMDKVVQQNAANAEENASASEELTAQAQQMNGFVGELVSMVGESANGSGTVGVVRGKESKALGIAGNHTPALTRTGHRNQASSVLHGTEVSPENTIPLDDDEDFKSF